MPTTEEGSNASGGAGNTTEAKGIIQSSTSGEQSAAKAETTPKSSADTSASGKAPAAQDAIELLKADHRKVEQLFAQYESANGKRKKQIVADICRELITHTILKEEIFYPACREAASEEEPLDEAQVEHDSAKLLVRELMMGEDDDYRDAKVKVLSEQIKHHVAEEEKPREGILAKAQSAGVDTAELGRRILERKRQLQAEGSRLSPTRPVSFRRLSGAQDQAQENGMPRSQGPERDDRGRFMSDDDDRRGGRSASERRYADDERRSFSRRDDDDDRRETRSRGRDDDDGRGWYGDSREHSEAARRGWESRGGGRDRDDDDDRRGSSRSRGRDDDNGRGWYGDSRGHSEAARRGAESRGRDRDDDDDDRRGSRTRGRDDDDGRGWYGDSRGHAEAARRGAESRGGGRDRDDDDDDRRGSRSRSRDDDDGRGWYGDSRGHAEAARRGWESRGGGRDDDDDRRSSRSSSGSRSRDDDDDRGRGRGGWFGDSRGHAEAARRGWEDRR